MCSRIVVSSALHSLNVKDKFGICIASSVRYFRLTNNKFDSPNLFSILTNTTQTISIYWNHQRQSNVQITTPLIKWLLLLASFRCVCIDRIARTTLHYTCVQYDSIGFLKSSWSWRIRLSSVCHRLYCNCVRVDGVQSRILYKFVYSENCVFTFFFVSLNLPANIYTNPEQPEWYTFVTRTCVARALRLPLYRTSSACTRTNDNFLVKLYFIYWSMNDQYFPLKFQFFFYLMPSRCALVAAIPSQPLKPRAPTYFV